MVARGCFWLARKTLVFLPGKNAGPRATTRNLAQGVSWSFGSRRIWKRRGPTVPARRTRCPRVRTRSSWTRTARSFPSLRSCPARTSRAATTRPGRTLEGPPRFPGATPSRGGWKCPCTGVPTSDAGEPVHNGPHFFFSLSLYIKIQNRNIWFIQTGNKY